MEQTIILALDASEEAEHAIKCKYLVPVLKTKMHLIMFVTFSPPK